ncbi:MAG: type II toxin-antitoxin system VapC family toxin [Chloroflexi bacterium]|nr:type II toxin-antitoxin system VapC family toxin [Chloroflexota bacterium]
MKRFLLDTSALLTLRDDEAGAEGVANLLYQAERDQTTCYVCFVTLMELLYRVWRDEGAAAGRLAYEQCKALPISWIHEDPPLLEKAAELKATHPVSLADAWIADASILQDATLVHKDPEFEVIKCRQQILPYK